MLRHMNDDTICSTVRYQYSLNSFDIQEENIYLQVSQSVYQNYQYQALNPGK